MTPRIFCHNDALEKLWYNDKPDEGNVCHDNNAVIWSVTEKFSASFQNIKKRHNIRNIYILQ